MLKYLKANGKQSWMGREGGWIWKALGGGDEEDPNMLYETLEEIIEQNVERLNILPV